jgi:alpha-amylase/alpha-mannosidase (GH57 family)
MTIKAIVVATRYSFSLRSTRVAKQSRCEALALRSTLVAKHSPVKPLVSHVDQISIEFQYQWIDHKGQCGICGDPYEGSTRNHEAPGGRYANGIIVKEYKVGQVIKVEVDITANHRGSFTFKMCPNNNPDRDSDQSCFDRFLTFFKSRYFVCLVMDFLQ